MSDKESGSLVWTDVRHENVGCTYGPDFDTAMLVLSQGIRAQDEEQQGTRPDKTVFVLPEVGEEPLEENTVYSVDAGSLLAVHVRTERPDAAMVKAEIKPKATLMAKEFRAVVQMAPNGQPALTGTGQWVLLVEVARPGNGMIEITAGRRSHTFNVKVNAAQPN